MYFCHASYGFLWVLPFNQLSFYAITFSNTKGILKQNWQCQSNSGMTWLLNCLKSPQSLNYLPEIICVDKIVWLHLFQLAEQILSLHFQKHAIVNLVWTTEWQILSGLLMLSLTTSFLYLFQIYYRAWNILDIQYFTYSKT